MAIIPPKLKTTLRKLKSRSFNGTALVYHSVGNENSEELLQANVHHITQDEFEKQLRLLKKTTEFVHVDELISRIKKGQSLRGLTSITFDDGYKNFYSEAVPVLESMNIPVTLFLCSSLIEGRPFWRDKVRFIIQKELVSEFSEFLRQQIGYEPKWDNSSFYQLSKTPQIVKSSDIDRWMDAFFHSIEINLSNLTHNLYLSEKDLLSHPLVQYGNHTANHYVMSSLSKAEQLHEIEQAERFLKSLGLPLSETFAIPFGDARSYNEDTFESVEALGYESALLARADGAYAFHDPKRNPSHEKLVIGMRFLPGKNHLYSPI